MCSYGLANPDDTTFTNWRAWYRRSYVLIRSCKPGRHDLHKLEWNDCRTSWDSFRWTHLLPDNCLRRRLPYSSPKCVVYDKDQPSFREQLRNCKLRLNSRPCFLESYIQPQ